MDTLPKVLAICFPDMPVKWNKTDYFITLPNGSEYWIAGLDDDKRTEKILGKEYSTIHFNECSQLTYSSVQMALTRLAELNDLKNKAYYDMNPPSKNSWTYWQFIKKLNPVDSEPLKRPENFVSIVMNPIDNLDNIDSEYIELLESLPEKERERFLHGIFSDSDDGQVYYGFDYETHVKEFDTPKGSHFLGLDFNVDPMTTVMAKIADDKLWVYDEEFQRNSDTYKMAKALRAKCKGQVYLIPDSTGKNRKTSGKSDFFILEETFGNNSIKSTRNPFVTDRTNNINRLFQENRIIIHPRCKKLINDLEKVHWKDNKLDQKTDKLLTHISDALGYLAWKMLPYEQQYDSRIVIR